MPRNDSAGVTMDDGRRVGDGRDPVRVAAQHAHLLALDALVVIGRENVGRRPGGVPGAALEE